MDINKMRNIVILKDLPSNLVEEAFVVLKKNQKIKKMEYADSKFENVAKDYEENDEQYVVKEAELLISNYIKQFENNTEVEKNNNVLKKYKKLKFISIFLGLGFIISMFFLLQIS